MYNALVIVAIILVVNIVYVSLLTIRMILTLKSRRYLAALVSVFETIMYIIGLSLVLDNLDGIQNVIAYAAGFATGIIVGSLIEERLALGYITVNVISTNPELEFTKKLRAQGYGVTSWEAQGMEGTRLALQVLTPRKRELKLYQAINEIDPRAFIISYEPKQIQGGFWVRQVRKRNMKKELNQEDMMTNTLKVEENEQNTNNKL
ncbi:MAG TPA: DUF2179 domain-containing protein [Pseudogracilibacillus sp.]|nr:DUF2179 domain-containing protein [Pseudogracilibacillus sp.]